MPRTGDARQRMIKTTARLFRRRGSHGTGLQEVLADSGAPRGSLYFHFPDGKQQLTEEAVRYEAAGIGRRLRRMLDEKPLQADAVRLMFDSYADWLERTEFAEGCPVAAGAPHP